MIYLSLSLYIYIYIHTYVVLKTGIPHKESLCPVVLGPYLCSSEMYYHVFHHVL